MNDFLNILHARKSVRNFIKKPVSEEFLYELIRAGMAAPTARNMQAWEFLLITEKELLNTLAQILPYAKMLADVPAAIVVMGDSKNISPSGHSYWIQDCCAATENILLAAESLGLGAVWTALYPYDERMKPVIERCSIPDHIIPLNIIPVGWPSGKDTAKKKFNPDKIHRNKWEQK